jgi:hypothetical protein
MFRDGSFDRDAVLEQRRYARWCRDTILGFERYGDAVINAILSDFPSDDGVAALTHSDARGLFGEWRAYWGPNEPWAPTHVRAGWITAQGLESGAGQALRLTRLSLDGESDVLNDGTWLDAEVARIFNVSSLPQAYMPLPEEGGPPAPPVPGRFTTSSGDQIEGGRRNAQHNEVNAESSSLPSSPLHQNETSAEVKATTEPPLRAVIRPLVQEQIEPGSRHAE